MNFTYFDFLWIIVLFCIGILFIAWIINKAVKYQQVQFNRYLKQRNDDHVNKGTSESKES